MTFQILLLLVLLAVALVFFWRETVPAEVVALGLLLLLVFTGLVPKERAFDGFGSDTVIMILGLFILTAALERTGVVDIFGRFVLRHAGTHHRSLLWAVMLASASIGAFISNTASTAFFLPMVFGIAQKSHHSASKFLLPLAFSSILTSSVTLVSSSTNMVVSGIMVQQRMAPMGMFEMAPVGVVIAIVGLVYMGLVEKFIPDRGTAKDVSAEFDLRSYLSEILVLPDSRWVGKTLEEANIRRELGLNVVRVVRNKTEQIEPRGNLILQAQDVLMVAGNQEDLVKIKDVAGVEIVADTKLSASDLASSELALAEVVLLPGSLLIGRTLQRQRFRDRYGLNVIGINHRGVNFVRKLSEVTLRLGDVLLVQGKQDMIARLHSGNLFRVLGPLEPIEGRRPRRRHAPIAILTFVGVIGLVSFQVVSLPLAAMLGAFVVFCTRCITPAEAYEAIEWKAILLIGCLLSLGIAMDHTGAAKYIAHELVALAGDSNPTLLLTVFFALTVFLTQPMSNQAAAIVALPVAIETAVHTHLNPRTFAMMIAVAASCSYLTPLEPACLMVYGPGRYKFADFLKIGSVLTILIYIVSIIMVPRVWPLR
ncbi:MAG: SLC13 family permease [Nibricoccus sp.]